MTSAHVVGAAAALVVAAVITSTAVVALALTPLAAVTAHPVQCCKLLCAAIDMSSCFESQCSCRCGDIGHATVKLAGQMTGRAACVSALRRRLAHVSSAGQRSDEHAYNRCDNTHSHHTAAFHCITQRNKIRTNLKR